MIPYFQEILKKKRLFVWGAFNESDLRLMREHLPARGLALQPIAETPEEMWVLIQCAKELWL